MVAICVPNRFRQYKLPRFNGKCYINAITTVALYIVRCSAQQCRTDWLLEKNVCETKA